MDRTLKAKQIDNLVRLFQKYNQKQKRKHKVHCERDSQESIMGDLAKLGKTLQGRSIVKADSFKYRVIKSKQESSLKRQLRTPFQAKLHNLEIDNFCSGESLENRKKNLYQIYKEEMERKNQIKKLFNMSKIHNFNGQNNDHLLLLTQKDRKETNSCKNSIFHEFMQTQLHFNRSQSPLLQSNQNESIGAEKRIQTLPTKLRTETTTKIKRSRQFYNESNRTTKHHKFSHNKLNKTSGKYQIRTSDQKSKSSVMEELITTIKSLAVRQDEQKPFQQLNHDHCKMSIKKTCLIAPYKDRVLCSERTDDKNGKFIQNGTQTNAYRTSNNKIRLKMFKKENKTRPNQDTHGQSEFYQSLFNKNQRVEGWNTNDGDTVDIRFV